MKQSQRKGRAQDSAPDSTAHEAHTFYSLQPKGDARHRKDAQKPQHHVPHLYCKSLQVCMFQRQWMTMAHLNFILRSHQQVLEGRNKSSINRASARTQRLDGTAVKLIDMLIANFLHISLQFLGPKAMKHLFEHQQAKPQKLSMPHQVIPHLTRHAGGIFLHDMSVFCGRCLTCPSTLQV